MLRSIGFFVLLLMLSPLVTSAADPQTGGLPDVAARVKTLETLVTTLQTSVATLQTNVTALQSANSGLQNALNAEIAARTAADTALQSALNKEIEIRDISDAFLNGLLSLEKKDRIGEDQWLESLINASEKKTFSTGVVSTFLPNGDLTRVATLGPLPPGNYFVTGKALVDNQDHNAFWQCDLVLLEGTIELDRAFATTESNGVNAVNTHAVIVFEQIVNLTAPGTVTIQCHTGKPSSYMGDIHLIAIQVGSPG